jgi:ketosteroid isomerase-like protein
VSGEALKVVEEIQATLTTEDVVAGLEDDEQGANLESTFARLASPDFEVIMVGPDYNPRQAQAFTGRGTAGFTEVWEEWTSAFENFRIDIERTTEHGEKVLTLVTLSGRSRTGGVEVSQPAAAVWTVRDGKLTRAEFHLDRELALKAAGLGSQSRQE